MSGTAECNPVPLAMGILHGRLMMLAASTEKHWTARVITVYSRPGSEVFDSLPENRNDGDLLGNLPGGALVYRIRLHANRLRRQIAGSFIPAIVN